jgi:dihydropteroate synthase
MLSRSFPAHWKRWPHAFYLGAELMKAEIAWRLASAYAQDEPLDWGCGVDR